MRSRRFTFDVFGTVVDWRRSIARELRSFFGRRGMERDWDAVAERWRALYQPAMEEVRRGRRPRTRLDDLHRDNLRVVLDEFGLGGLNDTVITPHVASLSNPATGAARIVATLRAVRAGEQPPDVVDVADYLGPA
jgi:FMN phosphatase YigB (HAD superfamily)